MLRFALAAALAASAAGCLDPADDDIIQWYDDFEACELCGWESTGAIARVETYHPGEHAMELGPHTAARHAIQIRRAGGERADRNNFDDGNWVELTTDCAGPGALTLREVAPQQLAIDVTLDERGPQPFTGHRLTLPPHDPEATISFVELTIATGAQTCRVDNVQVRISAGRYAY